MRDLRINTRPIYYAMMVGEKESVDRRGLPNGQKTPIYTKPRMAEVMVSTPTGDKASYPFGDFADYDKVLTTANEEFKADEYSVFWIDSFPVIQPDGTTSTPFDYKAKRIAVWGTQKSVAVSRVTDDVDMDAYLKKLLETGAITEEEYNERMSEETDED